MTFRIKASKGKRILYAIVNASMILFMCFWVVVLIGILNEGNTLAGLILLGIMWTALMALFIYAIYSVIYTMHLYVTVDAREKTFTIKKAFRRPVTISLYDIQSWKVKIVNGKSGEASRNIFINYEGGKVKVSSLLENWEKLRLYPLDNAEDKLQGEEGKEVTAYSYLADATDNELFKDSKNGNYRYEDRITEDAFFILLRLMPRGFFCDYIVYKNTKGSIVESLKDHLRQEWEDESLGEYREKVDSINFSIQRESSDMAEFLGKVLGFMGLKSKEIKKTSKKLEKSLINALGQPRGYFSLSEPLSTESRQALQDLTFEDNIVQLFFMEFDEYVVCTKITIIE